MENTKTTLTNLDTGKDRNALLQKAWQAVSVLVLLALSACGDNAGIQIRRTKWKSLVKLQSKLETLLTRV